jgi:ATP-dependent RNA helicase DeaD
MVATDIAARGIDISDLSHVINYSLPEDPAVFLHRVGRTGRIGKKGTSLSIVSGAEIHTLSALQKKFGIHFEQKALPTPDEARRLWTDRHVEELGEAMSASIFEAFIPLAQELRNRPNGDHLVAFALKYFFTRHRMERVQDLHKAEHKREEHERRESEPRRKERDRERRGGRDGAADGERGERGRRSRGDRRDRPERAARAEGGASEGGAARAPAEASVEVVAEAVANAAGGPPPESAARPPRGRIFLSLGEQDGTDEAKVRGAVAALAPGLELRAVELRRTHVFLEVAPDAVEGAVLALNGKDWEGKALTAERARRRRR